MGATALARAYKLQEIEDNPSLIEGVTKECSGCDPDSPRCVPREKCTVCKGTGREGLALVEILQELKDNRKVGEDGEDDGYGEADDESADLEY
jgi:hypothetical protein